MCKGEYVHHARKISHTMHGVGCTQRAHCDKRVAQLRILVVVGKHKERNYGTEVVISGQA